MESMTPWKQRRLIDRLDREGREFLIRERKREKRIEALLEIVLLTIAGLLIFLLLRGGLL